MSKLKGIAVDLDGTLIKTDLSLEGLVLYLKSNPLRIFWIAYYHLLHGRAATKCLLSKKVKIDPTHLPYKNDVIEWLSQNKKDLPVILITGSPTVWGKLAADFIEKTRGEKLFDDVVGTTPEINRIGLAKVDYLQQLWGSGEYAYVGDSRADRKVFKDTKKAIIIGSHSFFKKTVKKLQNQIEKEHILTEKKLFKNLISCINVPESLFNLALLIPMLIQNQFNILKAVIAFFAFSFLSSSISMFSFLSQSNEQRGKIELSLAFGLAIFYSFFLVGILLAASISLPFFIASLGFALFFFQSLHSKKNKIVSKAMMIGLRIGIGFLLIKNF
jgi:hypothetical protein